MTDTPGQGPDDWVAAGLDLRVEGGIFYQDPLLDWNPPNPAFFVFTPDSEFTSFYTSPADWPNTDYDGTVVGIAASDDPDIADTGSGLPPIVDMGAHEFGDSDPQPCRGDLDGDRDVDVADLATLLVNYRTMSGADGADGDMDCDGDVELADLAALLGMYGTICD